MLTLPLHPQVELALQVQLNYLESQLEDSTNNEGSIEKNIHTYCCGDFASLVSNTPLLPLPPLDNVTVTSPGLTEVQLESLKEMETFLWKQMVVRRNRKMTKSIDELLKTERNVTYFFALGAGQCFVVEMLFVCYRVRVCVFECGLFYVACMITHTPIDSHTHLHRHIHIDILYACRHAHSSFTDTHTPYTYTCTCVLYLYTLIFMNIHEV